VPGAFETPYQSAPLDIAEDCFYYAREGLIRDRLTEIERGSARELLNKIDDQHRPRGTWCVGVRWDMFEKQDLLEIVDVSDAVDRLKANPDITIVSWGNVTFCYLPFVLRGLYKTWGWGSGFDHLEGAAGRVQICRGERTWRFSTREPEGELSYSLCLTPTYMAFVGLDRRTSSGRSRG
jgi:hypothetical protein